MVSPPMTDPQRPQIPPRKMSRSHYWLSFVGGLAAVGACAVGVLLVRSGDSSAAPTVRSTTVESVSARSAAGNPAIYRDGSFNATGHYSTPGGYESIGVRIDVRGGVITAAQVQTEAHSPTARQFQDQFGQHISSQVVARDLSTLSVSRVSGASLTSLGFNDALARIRSEAAL